MSIIGGEHAPILSNGQITGVLEPTKMCAEVASVSSSSSLQPTERQLIVPCQQHSRRDPRAVLKQIVELAQVLCRQPPFTLLLDSGDLPEAPQP